MQKSTMRQYICVTFPTTNHHDYNQIHFLIIYQNHIYLKKQKAGTAFLRTIVYLSTRFLDYALGSTKNLSGNSNRRKEKNFEVEFLNI